ncbi:unnamed protein product, partial [Candidula unifasciata]
MGPTDYKTSVYRVADIIGKWDKGTTKVRKRLLQDFVVANQGKTGPEVEHYFAQAESLFLFRMTSWLRLTYMTGTCTHEILCAVAVFLSVSNGHKFMADFIESGGTLTLLEIIDFKQTREVDKREALKCLYSLGNAGRKYKELICECSGIRAVAECLARSKQEETQNACKTLLLLLADGNPKFKNQVYKGLIAILTCNSPKAHQLACNALRTVQPIVASVNSAIIEPLLKLLGSLHLEVQFEVTELLKDLMHYEAADAILTELVALLRPAAENSLTQTDRPLRNGSPDLKMPLSAFVQQAAAAKTIGILARESKEIAAKLIKLRVTHHLLYALGNTQHADSQRQASIALKFFCQNFYIVDDSVQSAMGETLYDLFKSNPESLYLKMSDIHADVLVSNQVNIPK